VGSRAPSLFPGIATSCRQARCAQPLPQRELTFVSSFQELSARCLWQVKLSFAIQGAALFKGYPSVPSAIRAGVAERRRLDMGLDPDSELPSRCLSAHGSLPPQS